MCVGVCVCVGGGVEFVYVCVCVCVLEGECSACVCVCVCVCWRGSVVGQLANLDIALLCLLSYPSTDTCYWSN